MGKDMAKNFDVFNLKDDFIIFKERLELWFSANKIKEEEEKKIQLLTSLSLPAYKLIRNMCSPVIPEKKTYDELCKMMSNQFVDRSIIFKERRRFYELVQHEGEKVLDFFNKIQAIAVGCDFKDDLNKILRDKFVCGLTKGAIFERLCDEKADVSIEDCLKIAMTKETTVNDQAMNMHKIKRTGPKHVQKHACAVCGKANHKSTECKYKGYRCNVCNDVGHLAKMCRNGKSNGNKKQRRNGKQNHHVEEDNEENHAADYETINQPSIRIFQMDMFRNNEAHVNEVVNHVSRESNYDNASPCDNLANIELRKNVNVCDSKWINLQNLEWKAPYNEHESRWLGMSEDCGITRDVDMFVITEDHQDADNILCESVNLFRNQNINYNFVNNVLFSNSRLFTIILKVNQMEMEFEIDTGSAISAIPLHVFEKHFRGVQLKSFNPVLRAYNGGVISTTGCFEGHIEYNGMSVRVNFVVINKGCRPLIGRDIFRKLNLKITLNSINTSDILDKFLSEFKSVFKNELGKYNGNPIRFKIAKEVKPIFAKARTVPFAYKENLEKELDKLEKENVIKKVDMSDWGTPLVVIVKKTGGLRICADYSVTINPHLDDMNYPLPRIEELFRALSGGKLFTKIDLSKAYHQLPVDDETSRILAWSTHKGIYAVNRLPFGCKPNTAIFQSLMEKLLLGCKSTAVFVDDIVITGKTIEEHISNVKEVLGRLQKAGLTVNYDKCEFFKKFVHYLGYIIDADGLHKDQSKVEAIIKMPTPKTPTEVKSLCGLINYYSRFLPNLSPTLKPIYDLIKAKEVVWTKPCQVALDLVKKHLLSNEILVHYDASLPLLLKTDASELGIGACISHIMRSGEERPIAFASRTLSSAESNYSAIDREALGIFFGVKRFEQYLLGRKFVICTDHKPLVAIFGSKKGIPCMAASRLQRWAIYLSNFQFEIKHVKGIDNGCADALSRLTYKNNVEDTSNEYSYLNFIKNNFSRPIRAADVAIESNKDPILSKIINYVRNGWAEITDDNAEMRNYYEKRHSLSLDENVLMWGHRAVIPKRFRETLLEEMHTTHVGVVKLKSIARSYFWWPKIDADIEHFVKNCEICRSNQNNPPRVESQPWPATKQPMERVHIDYFGPINNVFYLVLIDVHSKWIEVGHVKDTSSASTILLLNGFFARLGFPVVMVSDNARYFTSIEFEKFCEENGVRHITSPPYHPASNGPAENAVRVVKKTFYKQLLHSFRDNKNIDDIIHQQLYIYRNTPHSTTNKTPFEMLFNRESTIRWKLLIPQKSNMNDHIQINSKRINVGDDVYAKNFRSLKWVKAVVIKILGSNIFLVKIENGQTWKRHANQLTILMKSKNDNGIDFDDNQLSKNAISFCDILSEKIKLLSNDRKTLSGLNAGERGVVVPQEINTAGGENCETFEDALEFSNSDATVDSNISAPPEPSVNVNNSTDRPKRVIKKPVKLNL